MYKNKNAKHFYRLERKAFSGCVSQFSAYQSIVNKRKRARRSRKIVDNKAYTATYVYIYIYLYEVFICDAVERTRKTRPAGRGGVGEHL